MQSKGFCCLVLNSCAELSFQKRVWGVIFGLNIQSTCFVLGIIYLLYSICRFMSFVYLCVDGLYRSSNASTEFTCLHSKLDQM